MAKSKQTFNKKEKEKKRLKKKQDKEERKELRKETSKGNTFEDMIAYVDENGNITSTPPDPTKKKTVINPDNIQIGISRQEFIEPTDTIRKGTVTFFNESKGYGFIVDTETQQSIFVHANGLVDPIKEKDKVTFEIEKSPKGLRAIDVKLKS